MSQLDLGYLLFSGLAQGWCSYPPALVVSHTKEGEQGVNMWCMQCEKTVATCECPDIEERLSDLAKAPSINIAVQQNQDAREREHARKAVKKNQE